MSQFSCWQGLGGENADETMVAIMNEQ